MTEGEYKMDPPLTTHSLMMKMREVVFVIIMSEGGDKIRRGGIVGTQLPRWRIG